MTSGMTPSLVVSCLIGAAVVGGTLWNQSAGAASSAPGLSTETATETYGEQLLRHTTSLLGPDAEDPAMRYAGNRLNCASCHLGAGADSGTLSLTTAIERYPRSSPRSGGPETMEDRINGCMTRSMAGKALPADGPEMQAMIAYLRSLAARNAATGASLLQAKESPVFKTPARRADLQAGEHVFKTRCAACHQDDGQGLQASADLKEGFVFPPLWGPNSFNDGAGMHRVLTAARFIKARMPLGSATLTDDEAFDVAAFVNSQPRPEMADLDRDYPDKAKKPVDAGFEPFADEFPLEQHRFGPFAPIEAYYKSKAAKK